jgi:hypothetical protein
MSIPKQYTLRAGQIVVDELPVARLFFAQALFNSIVIDWILRFSVAMNVNKTYLMRLPLPQPDDAELQSNANYAALCRNSLLLSLYHNPDGFKALLGMFGVTDKDTPRTVKQVDTLKVNNDIIVAKLYGVTKADMEHILTSFTVLKSKRPEYVSMLTGKMP